MTRPDVEGIYRLASKQKRGVLTTIYTEDAQALRLWIAALEAARADVLPLTALRECNTMDTVCLHCLREDFDAAVARWTP